MGSRRCTAGSAIALVCGLCVLHTLLGMDPASAEPPKAAAPKGGATVYLRAIRDYRSWNRFSRYVRPVRSQGHGDAYVVGYYNRVAARAVRGDDLVYPEDSLLVLENRPAADQPPSRLSVMAMTADGWFWIEATARGAVALSGGQPQAGELRQCIRCHARAGADLVYSDGIR